MATEPQRNNYQTEKQYAEAWAAYANLRELEKVKNWNLRSDDNNNSGTTNTVASASGSVTMTQINQTGQKSQQTSVESGTNSAKTSNMLSKFSSSTYSITLYMVGKNALTKFSNNGGILNTNDDDVYIIAQSGGVNEKSQKRLITKSGNLGPNESGYDYYIDDLIMTTAMPGNPATGSTYSYDISFNIYEPLGFGFLYDLQKMTLVLNQKTGSGSGNSESNPFQQFYIMAIRFYGYDVNGNIYKSSESGFNSSSSDSYAISERFLSLTVTNFTYSVSDKSTIYAVTCQSQSAKAANTQIYGSLKKNISVTGGTVKDMLVGNSISGSSIGSKSLVNILNQQNLDLKDKNFTSETNTYRIEFLNDKFEIDDNSEIATARVISDISRQQTPMGKVNNVQDSSTKQAVAATTTDVTKQNATFPEGMAIIQIIDDIITQSEYFSKASNSQASQTPETTTKSNPSPSPLKSWSINIISNPTSYDKKTNLWTYDIIYQICPKTNTYIRSPYIEKTTPYSGPFKMYDYIFTGLNSEILKLDLNYNNQFFVKQLITDNKSTVGINNSVGTQVPLVPSSSIAKDTGMRAYGGGETNQAIRASLYSPADSSTADMKILGDPDFIMTTVGVNQVRSSNSVGGGTSSKWSNDGSINPNSEDVKIEIRMYTPSDYSDNGLLDARGIIQFYTSEEVKSRVGGIVYKINTVESEFSNGQFTQTFKNMTYVPENMLTGLSSSKSDSGRAETNQVNSGIGSQRTSDARIDGENINLGSDARIDAEMVSGGSDARIDAETVYIAKSYVEPQGREAPSSGTIVTPDFIPGITPSDVGGA